MTQIERISTADERLAVLASRLSYAATSDATRRAYQASLRRYEKWCRGYDYPLLPCAQDTLQKFVASMTLSDDSPSGIERAIEAIVTAHKEAGLKPPDTRKARKTLRGYRKERPQTRKKAAPLTVDDLRAMVDSCDLSTVRGVRDRAIILLGFAMMARRSELTGLDVTDVRMDRRGMVIRVRSSKTDKAAAGMDVNLVNGEHEATCPVLAMQAWLTVLGDTTGPLFRAVDRHGRLSGDPKFAGRAKGARMTPQAVETILRRARVTSGVRVRYTPHSLRSGGATVAYEAGADALEIARHGRWTDGSRALLGYIRPIDQWEKNPMKGTGL